MGEDYSNATVFFKRKLKWYEKIWYFITGKKNEYQVLGKAKKNWGVITNDK